MTGWKFLRNVLIKGLLLFALLNLLVAAGDPLPALGRISAYNHLFPGRQRFPFGEDPRQAYNLSLYSLEAMFASHVLAGRPDPAGEFRVVVIGDSSVWGTLLKPAETLPGQLDAFGLTCAGRPVKVYNLGYPTISLTKDLMVLDEAMQYHPDLVVWPVTLEAMPRERQLDSPIAANNPQRIRALIARYNLGLDPHDPSLVDPNLWDRTLIGRRRALADLFRLQVYGMMWGATGIDQVYPATYEPAQRDFGTQTAYHDRQPPTLDTSSLALDVLQAGFKAAGDVPVLLVNEPMLVSRGANSDLWYNFFYPRWAYDQYRQLMADMAQAKAWNYLDAWDLVPEAEFTNSAIHMTPYGTSLLAGAVAEKIEGMCP